MGWWFDPQDPVQIQCQSCFACEDADRPRCLRSFNVESVFWWFSKPYLLQCKGLDFEYATQRIFIEKCMLGKSYKYSVLFITDIFEV